MFTKNFDILMAGATVGNLAATTDEAHWLLTDNTVSKSYQGTYSQTLFPYTMNEGSDYYGNVLGVFSGVISLGEDQDLGDIPAESYFDWKLQHALALTAVQTRMSRSITLENGVYYLNLSQTFTNNTGSNKKIIELGVYRYCYYSTSSSKQYYLMYRAKLPSAITVEAGANFQANLKIELPNFLPNKPSA